MIVKELKSGELKSVKIVPVLDSDYKNITKSKFWFNWKEEKNYSVFKIHLVENDAILGLVSIDNIQEESRIEIRLLAVSTENRGKNKKYDFIVGNLLTYACRIALRLYGELACVSLVPKTEIIEHYKIKYGMFQAGISLCLDGVELIELIKKYSYE